VQSSKKPQGGCPLAALGIHSKGNIYGDHTLIWLWDLYYVIFTAKIVLINFLIYSKVIHIWNAA